MKQSLWGRHAQHVAVVVLFLLPMVADTAPAVAEEPKGLEFDLLLHVVGADLGDLGSATPLSFDVGGLPVSLGAESGDTGNPGLRAGFYGTHTLPIGGGVSLVTTGNLEKTRYLQDSFLGRDRLTGATSLRYQEGNFRAELEPGINLDLLAGAVATQHLVLDARASRAITDYLAVRVESGWARRDHTDIDQAGAHLGHSRLGLDFTIGGKAKLGLAYEATQRWADVRRDSTARSALNLDFDLALLRGFDLGMSYQYCEDASVDDNLQPAIASSHALALTAFWQDPDDSYLTFSGGYTLDRKDPAGDGPASASHDGMINVALKF